MKRNNYHICSLIKTFYSSRLIQRNWKIYMFKKTYIPIKNFKKKKELVEYINILPPSLCGLFPGGIIDLVGKYRYLCGDFKNTRQLYSSNK